MITNLLNNIYRQKLNAGALQYTIVFSLLILMMLGLFLLYAQISSIEILQSEKQSQIIENIKSSVTILENNQGMFNNSFNQMQLLDNEEYKTKINISEWGLYSIVKIKAMHQQSQLSKIFLFTDNIRENDLSPSLYLSSSKHYLSVGGNTYLGNNTYLPAYGIRKAYVGGVGYERESLVQGKSYKASNTLPEINKTIKEKYFRLKNSANSSLNKTRIEDLKIDTVFNSFDTQSLVVVCPPKYKISNTYFDGNIIITGDNISIENSVSIRNCIVIAKSILIDGKFVGQGQFFAENKIELGESANLKVPSILYLDNQNKEDQIIIKENSTIYGDIIVPNFTKEKQETIIIEAKSKIVGQVYCNGYLSFDATLFGSLFTNGFIKKDRRGLYENYLVNVCIDIDRLPKEYSGVSLIADSKAKTCSEEVY